jgi:thiamine-phosphate pyrophosphorylase
MGPMGNATDRCRLCLVTPAAGAAEDIARRLGEALSGGDVAAVIVTAAPAALQPLAEALRPVTAARDVALLVHNDTRIAGRVGADGVHVDASVEDVARAVESARKRTMVGAGGIRSRHDAMTLAETEPDYLFFGRLDGDRDDAIFDRSRELAAWWASVALVPAVVMGGRVIASVGEAAAAGIDFVALRDAVWNDPRGPAAAVAEANGLLASTARAEAVA